MGFGGRQALYPPFSAIVRGGRQAIHRRRKIRRGAAAPGLLPHVRHS